MAKEDRQILENIAVDMVLLSMEHIGEDTSNIWDEVAELTDAQLIDFVTA